MPPIDPTPLGDEMAERMPEQKFPQPKPGQESDEPVRGTPTAVPEQGVDGHERPQLPDETEPMAADVEDEEADPVVDTGPGIIDGADGLQRQRG